jgi:FMN phosphatase YigB (HAD superfamily)|tara:strand:+ start:609 stop:1046 length:438 start_codon:yes stop_codon:yes gene_type:complete
MNTVIFDIDGTLADISQRLPFIQQTPKDWDSFKAAAVDDAPIPEIIWLARVVAAGAESVIYMSGRNESSREITWNWLKQNGLPEAPLYMRADGDFRPDFEVKAELLERAKADGYDPFMAIDDRTQVVEMWRSKGIRTLQVAKGDY